MNKVQWSSYFQFTSDDASPKKVNKKAAGSRVRNTGSDYSLAEYTVGSTWGTIQAPGISTSAPYVFPMYNAGTVDIFIRNIAGSEFAHLPPGKVCLIVSTVSLDARVSSGSAVLKFLISGNA